MKEKMKLLKRIHNYFKSRRYRKEKELFTFLLWFDLAKSEIPKYFKPRDDMKEAIAEMLNSVGLQTGGLCRVYEGGYFFIAIFGARKVEHITFIDKQTKEIRDFHT